MGGGAGAALAGSAWTTLGVGLPVSSAGTVTNPFVWPADMPADTLFFVQHWIADSGRPLGYASSNGLQGAAR